jgi:hypothetical protein
VIPVYEIGDVVEATAFIERADQRARMFKGDRGKVHRVHRASHEGAPQIIDVILPDGWIIGSLVVFDTLPIKKA